MVRQSEGDGEVPALILSETKLIKMTDEDNALTIEINITYNETKRDEEFEIEFEEKSRQGEMDLSFMIEVGAYLTAFEKATIDIVACTCGANECYRVSGQILSTLISKFQQFTPEGFIVSIIE